MEHSFWHKAWETEQPAFHQDDFHPLLVEWFDQWIGAAKGAVFIPLCGKSLDIHYINRNHSVIGSELSAVACLSFFNHYQAPVEITSHSRYQRFHSGTIDLLAGDFFALLADDVKDCHHVYDRAALIALPIELRQQYVSHLRRLLPSSTKLLLISLEYPAAEMKGPPFAVVEDEINRLFDGCKVERVKTAVIKDGKFAQRTLRLSALQEVVYFIEF